MTRDDITGEWHERGAQEGRKFAILTDTLHRGTFDITTAEHKSIKALKKRDNLRDSMSIVELALTSLAEATSTALHREHDSEGFGQLQGDARLRRGRRSRAQGRRNAPGAARGDT